MSLFLMDFLKFYDIIIHIITVITRENKMANNKIKKPNKKNVGEKNKELVELLRSPDRNLPARPFKDIPPHVIEGLSMQGFTQDMIAATIGISAEGFRKQMIAHPEYRVALERGKAIGLGQLAVKGMEMAMDGDKDMIKFFLKTRAGFVETNRTEITGKDGNDIVVKHTSSEKNVMSKIFGEAYFEAVEGEYKEVKEEKLIENKEE